MIRAIIDETITFTAAFAFVMPWTAVAITQDAVIDVYALAARVEFVHVAIAAPLASASHLEDTSAAEAIMNSLSDITDTLSF